MKYRNVIFDVDGTLFNTRRGLIRAIGYALDSMGVEYESPEWLATLVGPPLKHTMMNRFGMNEEDSIRAVDYLRECMREGACLEADEFPGMRDLLSELQASGARLFVATSKPQPFTELLVEHFGYGGFFDELVGSFMNHTRLTKSELIAHCIEANGLDREQTVMVGDRAVDVIGANAQGIASIGVGYGEAVQGEWEETPPTHYVVDLNDLGKLLLEG